MLSTMRRNSIVVLPIGRAATYPLIYIYTYLLVVFYHFLFGALVYLCCGGRPQSCKMKFTSHRSQRSVCPIHLCSNMFSSLDLRIVSNRMHDLFQENACSAPHIARKPFPGDPNFFASRATHMVAGPPTERLQSERLRNKRQPNPYPNLLSSQGEETRQHLGCPLALRSVAPTASLRWLRDNNKQCQMQAL